MQTQFNCFLTQKWTAVGFCDHGNKLLVTMTECVVHLMAVQGRPYCVTWNELILILQWTGNRT